MKRLQYDSYSFSPRELILYGLIWIIADAGITYLFYKNIVVFLFLLPAMPLFLKRQKSRLLIRRQKELSLQFRDAIMAVAASLSAGYSVENAFIEAGKDLNNLYGKDSSIVMEFSYLTGRLSANETLEGILMDLANRSGVEDIRDFADVFVTAKRSGGDLVSIIRRSAYHIGDKIEVKRDIETLMSAKKMEQRIMSAIPFLIIIYMSVNSPGFLNPLYHNIAGAAVMTVCLLMYLLALFLAEKIISIEV